MIGSLLITGIYDEFVANNPDIQLEICEAGRQELMNMLSENRLDLVFLPHNTPFDSNFKTQKVAPFEIVCCVKKGANNINTNRVEPQDLKGKPLVLFKDNFFQTNEIKKWFARAGVEPQILLQTDQLSTLQKIIVGGVAVGFMFKELIASNDEIEAISLSEPIPVRVSLVWKANVPVFTAMKRFMDYIK
jgi:DNA-binding transcriptional LysR family regulator